jgi:hypothetical protein
VVIEFVRERDIGDDCFGMEWLCLSIGLFTGVAQQPFANIRIALATHLELE